MTLKVSSGTSYDPEDLFGALAVAGTSPAELLERRSRRLSSQSAEERMGFVPWGSDLPWHTA